MESTGSLKAVIFDLDGVLCDTSRYHTQAWSDLVRGLGFEPPADLHDRVRGISRMASLRIALGAHAGDFSEARLHELAEQKNACYLNAIRGITPANLFEGVEDLFAGLRARGIDIALGSASKNAKTVLDRLRIAGRFDAVADGFAYRFGKPHPDVFLTAAAMLGRQPWECIVAEDADAGVSAALDGGFVAVGVGVQTALQHAHLCVPAVKAMNAEALIALHAQVRPDRWTAPLDPHDAGRAAAWDDLLDGADAVRVDFRAGVGGGAQHGALLGETHRRLDAHAGIRVRLREGEGAGGRRTHVTERAMADVTCRGRMFTQYAVEPPESGGSVTVAATIADRIGPWQTLDREVVRGTAGIAGVPSPWAGFVLRGRRSDRGIEETRAVGLRLPAQGALHAEFRGDATTGSLQATVALGGTSVLRVERADARVVGGDPPGARAAAIAALEEAMTTPFEAARPSIGAAWRRYWEREEAAERPAPSDRNAWLLARFAAHLKA